MLPVVKLSHALFRKRENNAHWNLKTTRIGIFIPSLITPMNSIYLSEKCSYLHQLFINVNIPLKNCVNMEIGHVNNISFVTFPVNFLYMY